MKPKRSQECRPRADGEDELARRRAARTKTVGRPSGRGSPPTSRSLSWVDATSQRSLHVREQSAPPPPARQSRSKDPRGQQVRPAREGCQTLTENLTGSAVARLGLTGSNNPRHNLDVSIKQHRHPPRREVPGQPAGGNYALRLWYLSSTNYSKRLILGIVG